MPFFMFGSGSEPEPIRQINCAAHYESPLHQSYGMLILRQASTCNPKNFNRYPDPKANRFRREAIQDAGWFHNITGKQMISC